MHFVKFILFVDLLLVEDGMEFFFGFARELTWAGGGSALTFFAFVLLFFLGSYFFDELDKAVVKLFEWMEVEWKGEVFMSNMNRDGTHRITYRITH